ncbi:DUF397 domain-containing protein [Amycolatopsis sp. NPDC051903]|uniref:DUF397 domain-containing protein n=1 Tax=Amycolatopsis sp. NPDC051903 TaxID=3363936 RepID=UPI0037BCD2AB
MDDHVMDVEVARATLAGTTIGWSKSSYSGGQGECVEVDAVSVPGWAGIRDSKLGSASPVLVLADSGWAAFLAVVKGDEVS